jgi:hypothetical protein
LSSSIMSSRRQAGNIMRDFEFPKSTEQLEKAVQIILRLFGGIPFWPDSVAHLMPSSNKIR